MGFCASVYTVTSSPNTYYPLLLLSSCHPVWAAICGTDLPSSFDALRTPCAELASDKPASFPLASRPSSRLRSRHHPLRASRRLPAFSFFNSRFALLLLLPPAAAPPTLLKAPNPASFLLPLSALLILCHLCCVSNPFACMPTA